MASIPPLSYLTNKQSSFLQWLRVRVCRTRHRAHNWHEPYQLHRITIQRGRPILCGHTRYQLANRHRLILFSWTKFIEPPTAVVWWKRSDCEHRRPSSKNPPKNGAIFYYVFQAFDVAGGSLEFHTPTAIYVALGGIFFLVFFFLILSSPSSSNVTQFLTHTHTHAHTHTHRHKSTVTSISGSKLNGGHSETLF